MIVAVTFPMLTEEDLRFFGRHCVLFCWVDSTPGTEYGKANGGLGKPFTTTAFLMWVRNKGFLITAGHILGGIEDARRRGQKLTDFLLDDTLGFQAKYSDHSIPFGDFDTVWKKHVDQDGLDFAVMALSPHIGRKLQANCAEPIDEERWKNLPDKIEEYYLFGAPDKLHEVDTIGGLHVKRAFAAIPVQCINDSPESPLTKFPRIVYRISSELTSQSGARLDDIDGMSSGPLVGVKRDKTGKPRYCFLGIQSSWDKSKGIGFATPLKPIGEWLELGII